MSEKNLTELTFQQFREKFSTDEAGIMYHSKRQNKLFDSSHDYLYITPNEKNIPQFSRELQNLPEQFSPELFIGIIGGVDANLEYYTSLIKRGMPKDTPMLLTDINDKAIDHLAFLLYCTQGISKGDVKENSKAFFNNIENMQLDEKEMQKLFGTDNEGKTVDFSLYQEDKKRKIVATEMFNYHMRIDDKSLLFRNHRRFHTKGRTYSRPIKKEEYFRHLERDEYFSLLKEANESLHNSWLSDPEIINDAFNRNLIKAYRSNIFGQGKETLKDQIKKNDYKNIVVYVSDISGDISDAMQDIKKEVDNMLVIHASSMSFIR